MQLVTEFVASLNLTDGRVMVQLGDASGWGRKDGMRGGGLRSRDNVGEDIGGMSCNFYELFLNQ
jgi:hypothetical protein